MRIDPVNHYSVPQVTREGSYAAEFDAVSQAPFRLKGFSPNDSLSSMKGISAPLRREISTSHLQKEYVADMLRQIQKGKFEARDTLLNRFV